MDEEQVVLGMLTFTDFNSLNSNQLTGFYMMTTLSFNKLNDFKIRSSATLKAFNNHSIIITNTNESIKISRVL